MIRRENPTDFFNCHGWVFYRREVLLGPDDVELILKDNGYSGIQDPRPGDLVIYRADGIIIHSGVVRYVTPGQPVIVEGKWGAMGVFQHHAESSCYGTNFTFYRSAVRGTFLWAWAEAPRLVWRIHPLRNDAPSTANTKAHRFVGGLSLFPSAKTPE